MRRLGALAVIAFTVAACGDAAPGTPPPASSSSPPATSAAAVASSADAAPETTTAPPATTVDDGAARAERAAKRLVRDLRAIGDPYAVTGYDLDGDTLTIRTGLYPDGEARGLVTALCTRAWSEMPPALARRVELVIIDAQGATAATWARGDAACDVSI